MKHSCQSQKTVQGLSFEEKENFMRRAVELSQWGMEHGFGGPFGAVIVKDGKIIGEGFNRVTSSKDPTAHAEIVAIRNASKNLRNFDLSGATIFTSCEPCPMCLAAIYWANIDEIYYANTKNDADSIGFRDDFIYDEFSKPIDKRNKKSHQILRSEALVVFQKWIEKTNKIKY